MNHAISENPEIPLLLRGGEVARLLGVSRALAFRWMQRGVLPTVRMPGSRTVRVPHAALVRMIEQRTNFSPVGQAQTALEHLAEKPAGFQRSSLEGGILC
jgi:excisionase family DNA binding protein